MMKELARMDLHMSMNHQRKKSTQTPKMKQALLKLKLTNPKLR
jgi:hypothetical protein